MRSKNKWMYVLAGFSLAVILSIVISITFVAAGVVKFDLSDLSRYNFDLSDFADMDWDIDDLPDWLKEKLKEQFKDEWQNMSWEDVQNFLNSSEFGDIKALIIKTDGAIKIYDGEPLTCETWKVLGQLNEGHHAEVKTTGSQTAIGKSSNTANYWIYDESGNDVTSYYIVSVWAGDLIVTDENGYIDGEPAGNGNDDLMIMAGALLAGALGYDKLDIVPERDLLMIYSDSDGYLYLRNRSFGDYDGKDFSVAEVYNGGGSKQVFNPAAYCVPTAGSNSVAITILDKRLSTCIPYYSLDEYSFAGDVELNLNELFYNVNYKQYDYLSSSIDPYSNELTEYNDFVHSNYLNIDAGLKEELKSLTNFTSSGKDMIKDIVKYVKNAATYNLDFPEIPEDEDTILYFLTQSKEGVCRHFAAAATMIFRAYGIPARYTVGFLAKAVKNTPVKVTSESAHAWVEIYLDDVGWIQIDTTPSGYNPPVGETQTIDTNEKEQEISDVSEIATEPIPEDDNELFKVLADIDEVLYFREKSYGDYNGRAFESANAYSYLFDGTEDVFNHTVDAISGEDSIAEITLLKDMPYRLIPYYSSDVYRLTDDVALKTDEKVYTTNFEYYNYLYDDSLLAYSNLTSYNGHVKNNYLNIDEELKVQLISLTNFTSEGKTLIKDVASFVKTAARYNLNFKPIPENSDAILYFLTESKEGICQHFAAAATMIYRAYGIPARYTVGYVVAALENEEIIVTAQNAHAWVEVYLNDVGWVQVEVTNDAGVPDYERTITISSENLSKVYDGEPLAVDVDNVQFDLSQLKDGHTIVATGIPEITHVSESGIYNAPKFVILDEDKNDVTDEYIIDYENCGTLEITKQDVKILAKGQKTYDGTIDVTEDDFYDENEELYFSIDGLRDGDEFAEIALTDIESEDVGNYLLNLEDFTIENSLGIDVTSDYSVEFDGEFEIIKREITVRTKDGTWLYDGEPHINDEYEILGNGIAANDEISVSVAESILGIGTKENKFEISIYRISDDETYEEPADKTFNYNIAYEYGILEITNIINVYSDDQAHVYDGETHYGQYTAKAYSAEFDTEYDVSEKFDISYAAAFLIDVGETENHRPSKTTVKIGELDLTDNYEFNYDGCIGTLTVNKRTITVQSDNCEKVYDGKVLTNDKDLIVGGKGLVEGHTISATFTESQLDKGFCDNVFTDVVITDGEDNEVTANYSFDESEFEFGTLTVTAKVVYLKSGSPDKTYDGIALIGTGYRYSVDGGESYTVIGVFDVGTGDVVSFTPSSIVNAGETKNELKDLKAKRNETEDVTGNYEFLFKSEEDCGTLTVHKRNITFISANANKVFDGAPLTKNSAEVYIQSDNEGLAPNERVQTYSFTGTRTDVGKSDNAFTVSDIIRESDGKSSLSNYNIEEYKAGTLEVTPKTIYVKTASDWKYYDGKALIGKGYQYSFDGSSFEDAVNNGDGTYYFELYKGDKAEFSSVSITEVGSIENKPQITVRNGGNNVTAKGNYSFNFSAGTLEIKEKPILPVIKITTDENAQLAFVYDGTAHSVASDKVIVEKPDGWNYEIKYNSITYVSESNKTRAAYVVNVTDGDGNPLTENTDYYVDNTCGYLVVNKLVLYFESSDTPWPYDGNEHFGTGYKFGYSSSEINIEPNYDALTGIYSALLSTGDEIKFKATSISATGIKENKPTGIKVEKDGTNVIANYSFGFSDCGTLKINGYEVTFTSFDADKTYDGTALTRTDFDNPLESLNLGYVVEASDFAERVDAGSVENTFTVTIKDIDGNDITSCFEISYVYGELTVDKRNITVTAMDLNKIYDGTALQSEEHQLTVGGDGLADGQTATAKFTGSITDVGTVTTSIGAVTICSDTDDVTLNYEITAKYDGTLTVEKRPITVKSDNRQKEYDGTPLTNGETNLIVGGDYGLADGQEIFADFTGSQTEIGSSDNTYENVKIKLGEQDTTSNYDIKYLENGTLTVTKIELTFNCPDGSKPYDGTALVGDCLQVGDKLLVGHELRIDYVEVFIGIAENRPTIRVYDGDTDVTDVFYNITYEYIGTLTVEKATIYISSLGNEFTYNGAPYEGAGYAQTGLVESVHRIEFTPKTFTNVWDSGKNIPTFVIYDSDNNPIDINIYYDIDYNGCENITINKCPLTISITGEKDYDGKAIIDQKYMTVKYNVGGEDRDLFNNQFAEITVTLKSANAGTFDKDDIILPYTYVLIRQGNEDMTGNYDKTISLDFIINKRLITVSTGNEETIYNGNDQCGTEISATNLVSEHEISATFDNYKHAGEYENSIIESTLKITKGGIDVTENYQVSSYDFGTFTINKKTVYVTSEDGTWTYDGTTHYGAGYQCEGYDDPVITGNTYAFTLLGSDVATFTAAEIIEPSTIDNKPQLVSITNDATYDYDFNFDACDKLKVEKILVYCTGGKDGEKVYDGTPLTTENTPDRCKVMIGSVDYSQETATHLGHNLVVNQASITNAGSVTNCCTVSITDAQGKNLIGKYYTISYDTANCGDLVVTKKSITVTSADLIYNSDTANPFGELQCDELIDGHKIVSAKFTAEIPESVNEPENIENAFDASSVVIHDEYGNDVSVNYVVTPKYGRIRVKPNY